MLSFHLSRHQHQHQRRSCFFVGVGVARWLPMAFYIHTIQHTYTMVPSKLTVRGATSDNKKLKKVLGFERRHKTFQRTSLSLQNRQYFTKDCIIKQNCVLFFILLQLQESGQATNAVAHLLFSSPGSCHICQPN